MRRITGRKMRRKIKRTSRAILRKNLPGWTAIFTRLLDAEKKAACLEAECEWLAGNLALFLGRPKDGPAYWRKRAKNAFVKEKNGKS